MSSWQAEFVNTKKHPLSLRWNHWLNFPLITLMTLSGLAIYWAYPAYFIPREWLKEIGLDHKLAVGLSWHFAMGLFFIVNGIFYSVFLFMTGHYKYLLPDRHSLKEAFRVVLHDLGFKKIALPEQLKYNAAQRLSYSFVFLMGVMASLTGLAIYKPAQLNFLLALLGGYKAARLEHFVVMILFILFFVVHISQVVKAGWPNFRAMITGFDIKTEGDRRSFIKAGAFSVVGLLGIGWISRMETDRGLPWLLRRMNDINDSFWKANFRKDALVATGPSKLEALRVNGDIGLEETIDEKTWFLKIEDPSQEDILQISLGQIKQMPSTLMRFEFKCIEGWSQNIECRGVKVSDFMNQLDVGQKNETSLAGISKTPYEYAALSSVNGGYYVSVDAKSLWHPQTLLCYEINGEPLTAEHGAPLRLMSAVKYGVKNIKQLGHIAFTDSPPADYWAEHGYQDNLIL
jgi:thiosulfate reductase cytochrome b subunit